MEKDPEFQPDIIDLQSWMCTSKDPKVIQAWEATKYLSAPYGVWLFVWKEAGKPNIDEEVNKYIEELGLKN